MPTEVRLHTSHGSILPRQEENDTAVRRLRVEQTHVRWTVTVHINKHVLIIPDIRVYIIVYNKLFYKP